MTPTMPRPTGRIVRAAEAQLWQTGEQVLQAAQEEAQRIREGSDQWLAQARDEGFEQGRLQGAEAVGQLLLDTQAQVDAYLAGLETALADLALNIAREVLDSQDLVERTVACTRKALVAFRQDQALTLFVPSAEVAAVRRRLESERWDLSGLTVQSDDQLLPGQARLSSPVGSVELGLDAQLAALRQSLLPHQEPTP